MYLIVLMRQMAQKKAQVFMMTKETSILNKICLSYMTKTLPDRSFSVYSHTRPTEGMNGKVIQGYIETTWDRLMGR